MRLFTIAPEQDFLQVLAEAICKGFPLEADELRPPLSRWTILVPTRRAARSLQHVLAARIGGVTVLPRIRPFGDVDEDELFAGLPENGVEDAISSAGQLNLLLGLVKSWSEDNPQETLARDLAGSAEQRVQMALSLQQLVNQMETEEADLAKLAATHDLELAFHRSAVLSLFELLTSGYQAQIAKAKLLGPSARRNRLIRLEAERLAQHGTRGPIIAAGSTGSNPATRALLQLIANLPQGAVIFPGLDVTGEASSIGPDHPHYSMVQTLANWSISLKEVKHLGPAPSARSHLAWMALRPSAETKPNLAVSHEALIQVEARDQTEEALVIALRMRLHMEEKEQGVAALITPDRTLAARVQAALARWHLRADDSAGDVLAERGSGALVLSLLDTRRKGYTSESLMALLHHPLCTWGLAQQEARRLTALLEIACVRGMPFGVSLSDLADLADKAQHHQSHPHPIVAAMTDEDFTTLQAFIARLSAVLTSPARTRMEDHLQWIVETLAAIAPEAPDSLQVAVIEVLEGLKSDAQFSTAETFDEAAILVAHHLRRTVLRRPLRDDTRILILGLPEARLVPLDLAILGGLNEGQWPAVPETGPWLNRAMRKAVGLEMPERDIGLTAHDFQQGLCRARVMLTWSERLGGKPVLPSRLVLRLRSMLEAQGVPAEQQLDKTLLHLARRLDTPERFAPHQRPQARPDVATRPRRFSVTEVEKLVRDSYHIHAKRILALQPLGESSTEPDYALRGQLIHSALAAWAHDPFTNDAAQNLKYLLKRGREAFKPYLHLPEVLRFWWIRFEQMAKALVEEEIKLRSNVASIRAEISGRIELPVDGVAHVLTARADRIDILHDGSLRIIDYKSGTVPTGKQVANGFAPQLPLEAVIAREGGFKELSAARVAEAYYVKVSGGVKKPVELDDVTDETIEGSVEQIEKLTGLLRNYLQDATVYIPRHNLQKEDEPADYDHLSRYAEWVLSGGGS
jgi:ATP-dependent helicase/nuclease subunit B